jgi:peptidoglycan/LPS O-acetylase OafA/YrhL
MDPIAKWLGHQNTPGEYAVSNFFILSGFLLMRSVRKDPSPLRFLANRLLRLVPAFWAALGVTLFFIAPFLSTVGLWEWFTSPALWKSFFDSAMCLGDYTNLPIHASRFSELEGFINGALWTLPYEFACYLFLLFLSVTLKTPAKIATAAFLFGLVSFLGPILLPVTAEMHQAGSAIQLPLFMHERTLPFFCAGIVLDFVDLKLRITKRHALPSLGLFLLSFFFHLEFISCSAPSYSFGSAATPASSNASPSHSGKSPTVYTSLDGR